LAVVVLFLLRRIGISKAAQGTAGNARKGQRRLRMQIEKCGVEIALEELNEKAAKQDGIHRRGESGGVL
jgi:hypothetical protein